MAVYTLDSMWWHPPISVNPRLVGHVIALRLKPPWSKEEMRLRKGSPYHGILCPKQDVHCSGCSCLEGTVVGDFVGSTIWGLKTIVHIGSTVQVVGLWGYKMWGCFSPAMLCPLSGRPYLLWSLHLLQQSKQGWLEVLSMHWPSFHVPKITLLSWSQKTIGELQLPELHMHEARVGEV